MELTSHWRRAFASSPAGICPVTVLARREAAVVNMLSAREDRPAMDSLLVLSIDRTRLAFCIIMEPRPPFSLLLAFALANLQHISARVVTDECYGGDGKYL